LERVGFEWIRREESGDNTVSSHPLQWGGLYLFCQVSILKQCHRMVSDNQRQTRRKPAGNQPETRKRKKKEKRKRGVPLTFPVHPLPHPVSPPPHIVSPLIPHTRFLMLR